MEVAILLKRKLGGCCFASLGFFFLTFRESNGHASKAKLLKENFPMLGKFALDAPLMR